MTQVTFLGTLDLPGAEGAFCGSGRSALSPWRGAEHGGVLREKTHQENSRPGALQRPATRAPRTGSAVRHLSARTERTDGEATQERLAGLCVSSWQNGGLQRTKRGAAPRMQEESPCCDGADARTGRVALRGPINLAIELEPPPNLREDGIEHAFFEIETKNEFASAFLLLYRSVEASTWQGFLKACGKFRRRTVAWESVG